MMLNKGLPCSLSDAERFNAAYFLTVQFVERNPRNQVRVSQEHWDYSHCAIFRHFSGKSAATPQRLRIEHALRARRVSVRARVLRRRSWAGARDRARLPRLVAAGITSGLSFVCCSRPRS